MSNTMLTISDVTAGTGIAVGLANIYNILGIILLVVNLGILIFNFVCRLRARLKDGEFTNEEKAETAKEILELTQKIKELQNQLENKENK